jgi:site-specific recombinase XerD
LPLTDADRLLNERDCGLRITGRDPTLNLLRDASFFLIGVLTGMRCEEIVGIETGACRTESTSGVTYHWLRSIEHKTKKGRVEYMMPEVCHRVIAVMERWSAPLRAELRLEAKRMAGASAPTGMQEQLRRRAEVLSDRSRLFLGRGGQTQQVRALSGDSCIDRMQSFADHAGVEWKLRPHQLRRAYAWTFVRHRLGNLLFLKEQFKHSSLSMTQLYAANGQQDEALYEDLFNEISAQKVELVDGWLTSDSPLAGKAGQRIALMRAHDFPDRKAMLAETMDAINIRSTGHSWCLAQDEGCGGAGLYEATRCGSCADAVIDGGHGPVWQAIRAHQLELLPEAVSLGPATVQRVQRDLQRTEDVLAQLGWVPQADRA